MDANHFDALTTRLVEQLSRRRGIGILVALGLGAGSFPETTEAGKKRRKKKITLCLDGQTIKVKKRNFQQKFPGATVGSCPSCIPITTCAAQGRVCGPLDDGCSTLICGECGTGDTPSCRDTGVCAACFSVCPPACDRCANRSDGATMCVANVTHSCTFACATNADCPESHPICVSTVTLRSPNTTTDLPSQCGKTSLGMCATITPC